MIELKVIFVCLFVYYTKQKYYLEVSTHHFNRLYMLLLGWVSGQQQVVGSSGWGPLLSSRLLG